MDLELIPVSKAHSSFIWRWRNDQVSRKMFKNQSFITWKDHKEWFERSLHNAKRIMYLGIREGIPVGIIRFDISNNKIDECFISINIAPKYRGAGIGKLMLKKSILFLINSDKKISVFKAEVKIKNYKSHKLFLNCGFKILSKNDVFIIYNYERPNKKIIE